MKRALTLCLCTICIAALIAQNKLFINKTDNTTLGAPISLIDSISFSTDGSAILFHMGSTAAEYSTISLDSLSFGENATTVYIVLNGAIARILNPLAFEGVSVQVSGADVSITSTTETSDINYVLTGTTTNGTFKINSEKRFNLLLNGVNITNTDGPAINIQSGSKASVILADGTSNYLADGTTYATAPLNLENVEEDQKSTFFSEGQLIFTGAGALNLKSAGTDKHALCSDDYIEVDKGNITISSALNDGIHAKEGVRMLGGTLI